MLEAGSKRIKEKTWQRSPLGSLGDKQRVWIRSLQQVVWASTLAFYGEWRSKAYVGDNRLYGYRIKAQQARDNTPAEGIKRMDLYRYCNNCWPEHHKDKKWKNREIPGTDIWGEAQPQSFKCKCLTHCNWWIGDNIWRCKNIEGKVRDPWHHLKCTTIDRTWNSSYTKDSVLSLS